MNQDELKILEINGKNYFLIDSLDGIISFLRILKMGIFVF